MVKPAIEGGSSELSFDEMRYTMSYCEPGDYVQQANNTEDDAWDLSVEVDLYGLRTRCLNGSGAGSDGSKRTSLATFSNLVILRAFESLKSLQHRDLTKLN